MTEMTQDQKKAFVVGTLNMPEKLYEDLRNASPKYIDNLVAAKDDLEAMFAGNREVIAEVHDHVNTSSTRPSSPPSVRTWAMLSSSP